MIGPCDVVTIVTGIEVGTSGTDEVTGTVVVENGVTDAADDVN